MRKFCFIIISWTSQMNSWVLKRLRIRPGGCDINARNLAQSDVVVSYCVEMSEPVAECCLLADKSQNSMVLPSEGDGDPWERAEAWRYKGTFSRWNRFRSGFPGLGIASVAFAGYCAYEYLFLNDAHHGEGHGEGHH